MDAGLVDMDTRVSTRQHIGNGLSEAWAKDLADARLTMEAILAEVNKERLRTKKEIGGLKKENEELKRIRDTRLSAVKVEETKPGGAPRVASELVELKELLDAKNLEILQLKRESAEHILVKTHNHVLVEENQIIKRDSDLVKRNYEKLQRKCGEYAKQLSHSTETVKTQLGMIQSLQLEVRTKIQNIRAVNEENEAIKLELRETKGKLRDFMDRESSELQEQQALVVKLKRKSMVLKEHVKTSEDAVAEYKELISQMQTIGGKKDADLEELIAKYKQVVQAQTEQKKYFEAELLRRDEQERYLQKELEAAKDETRNISDAWDEQRETMLKMFVRPGGKSLPGVVAGKKDVRVDKPNVFEEKKVNRAVPTSDNHVVPTSGIHKKVLPAIENDKTVVPTIESGKRAVPNIVVPSIENEKIHVPVKETIQDANAVASKVHKIMKATEENNALESQEDDAINSLMEIRTGDVSEPQPPPKRALKENELDSNKKQKIEETRGVGGGQGLECDWGKVFPCEWTLYVRDLPNEACVPCDQVVYCDTSITPGILFAAVYLLSYATLKAHDDGVSKNANDICEWSEKQYNVRKIFLVIQSFAKRDWVNVEKLYQIFCQREGDTFNVDNNLSDPSWLKMIFMKCAIAKLFGKKTYRTLKKLVKNGPEVPEMKEHHRLLTSIYIKIKEGQVSLSAHAEGEEEEEGTEDENSEKQFESLPTIKRQRVNFNPALSLLMGAGFLEAGKNNMLISILKEDKTRVQLTADLTPQGTIVFNSEECKSFSAFAKLARESVGMSSKGVNGWQVVKYVTPTDQVKNVSKIRLEYKASLEKKEKKQEPTT
mmetsp:Transcript_13271/g.23799  ORF Transcript_13271/g.23799 Transcript_13271/m.23799 type:complete len:830 (+) Transcript_13271:254-2743(+)